MTTPALSKIILTDSKDKFLEYLNVEIEQCQEEIKKPGWTNWAIMAGLATIIWLLILEFEKQDYITDQIYLLFLVFSFLLSIFHELYGVMKPKKFSKKEYFRPANDLLENNKIRFFISTAHTLILILLIVHFSTKPGKLPYYLALLELVGSLIFVIFSMISMFVMTKITSTNFYIPQIEGKINLPSIRQKRKKKSFRANTFLLVDDVLFIYLVICYSNLYLTTYGLNVTTSVKISALLIAILFLVKLITQTQDSPTLVSLQNVRRDLMFNNIDLEMAKQLAEITLLGATRSNIVQREFQDCLSTLRRIDSLLNQAKIENSTAAAMLVDSTSIAENASLPWISLRDAAYYHFKQAKETYISDKKLRGGFDLLVSMLKIYGSDDQDFHNTVEKTEKLFDQVKTKYDQTIQIWLDLIYKFEGREKAVEWLHVATTELDAELPDDFIQLITKNDVDTSNLDQEPIEITL